jgi:hypothetical protein
LASSTSPASGSTRGSRYALLAQGALTPAIAHLDIDQQGFAWLPEADFVGHFAADVHPVKARDMFAVQQPLPVSAYDDVMGVPAWKSLPSWFLVADGDKTIPPDAERLFAKRMGATTVEVSSNHVAMVSHPDDVRLACSGQRCTAAPTARASSTTRTGNRKRTWTAFCSSTTSRWQPMSRSLSASTPTSTKWSISMSDQAVDGQSRLTP